jgi:hypothetical protein
MELLDSNTAKYIAELERKISILTSMANSVDAPNALQSQSLGKAIPSILGIEISLLDTNGEIGKRLMGNARVEADGPFQARAIHFAVRGEDGELGDTFFKPPFYFEYQVSNSNRVRQNIPVASWLPRMGTDFNPNGPWVGCGMWDLPTEDIFPATSTVTVWITMYEIGYKSIYIGFSGAYLLK